MSPRLTDAELDEMERLDREVEPGEWLASMGSLFLAGLHPEGRTLVSGNNAHGDDDYSDLTIMECELIAAARNALPSLLSEVRRARLKEPYVRHHPNCMVGRWAGAKDCTCGLSALEASE